MKYTIHGLQQERLIELGLNNDDALILSVLRSRYASMKMEHLIINNQRYIWVDYTDLLERDIPILGSKSNLMSKIKKYEELGLILRKTLYEKFNKLTNRNEKGTYAYVCLTIKLDYLTEYEKEPSIDNKNIPYPKFGHPLSKNKIPPIQNLDNKDNPIIDNPIIDNTTTEIPENKEEKNFVVVVVDNLILKFNKKYKGNLDPNLLKNLIKIKGIDVVEKCIDIFEEYVSSSKEVEKVFYDFTKKYGTDKAYIKNTAYKPQNYGNSNSKMINGKPAQESNYEQREYSDEFYDNLYNNLEYIK
jgi:hypothetical protein